MAQARTQPRTEDNQLRRRLEELVGVHNVLSDSNHLDFFSSDIFDCRELAELVIRPGSPQETAAAVAECRRWGRAVVPRGGGMSYTGGYLPARPKSVLFDLTRLDAILEVNSDDMYVTVEAGVTWHQLSQALRPLGLRTPYWGTVSGYHATIGGGLSQGSTHFGSAQYGTSAETCLGLRVVTGAGDLLELGSAATRFRPSPFFRSYGPDLVGLFLNDTGALGIKVAATLKLIRSPDHQRYLSFAFDSLAAQLAAMAEISRGGLAAECGGWNPALVRRFARADAEIGEDLKYLSGVVRSGTSPLGGVIDAARLAFAGRRAWRGEIYLVHATLDDLSAAGADARAKAVKEIAGRLGGRVIPPSYPRAHRARPFADMMALPPGHERTVPTHGIAPHSRAFEMATNVIAVFERHAERLARHDISWSLITSTIGTGATLIEPLIHYPDARGAHYARDPAGPVPLAADPGTIDAVRAIRREVAEMFMHNGCAHLQIGKSYPYKEGRLDGAWTLLEAIKRAVDPEGLMNPGSLGLAP